MKNFFLLFSLACVGIAAFIHSQSKNSDCFNPSYVALDPSLLSLTGLDLPRFSLTQEECKIFDQPFHFLGSGHQCFAFESEDGQYVLKLIKFHYYLSPRSFSTASKQKEKLKRVLQGFSLAEHQNKKGCGLISVNLLPSKEIFYATLKDKAGRKYLLNLRSLPFALQEKATPTGALLKQLLDQGKVEEAGEKLKMLFAMFEGEFRKGLYDHDHNIIHNTGFTKNGPIRIDFGKLASRNEMGDSLRIREELLRLAHGRVAPWIKKYYPQYLEKLLSILDKFINSHA